MICKNLNKGFFLFLILGLVAPTTAYPQQQVCFDQNDMDCNEYASGLEDSLCNTQQCTSSHQLDSEGNRLFQNNFWLMDYDCKADAYEGVVQTGTISSCSETGGGVFADDEGTESTVHCVKIKYCDAGCNVTTQTDAVIDGKIVRKAFCKTGGGPKELCAEEFQGCNVPSKPCSHETCPPPDPGC